MNGTKATSHGNFCIRCNAWRGSLGLEPTFQLYIQHLVQIFDEVKRVLKKTGACFVNLGDIYGGSGGRKGHTHESSNLNRLTVGYGATEGNQQVTKHLAKSLLQIPSRVSIAMTERGWILRNTIIWQKTNCMPSSAKDRFTVDFEYLFFFVKNKKYYFKQQFEPYKQSTIDRSAYGHYGMKCQDEYAGINDKQIDYIMKQVTDNPQRGRNKRCVWNIPTQSFKKAHFATFPESLCETPILAGCPPNGIVLDPFIGSGTVAVVAHKLRRNWIGIELNPEYVEIAEKRIKAASQQLLIESI